MTMKQADDGRKLFINEQIQEEMRRDIGLTFHARNPQTNIEYPLTGYHALVYGVRWMRFCKSPAFVH